MLTQSRRIWVHRPMHLENMKNKTKQKRKEKENEKTRASWLNIKILQPYLQSPTIPFTNHSVKSVLIRIFSGLYFPASGLNMERYSVSLRI